MVHNNSLCFHIDRLGKYPFRLGNSLADWAPLVVQAAASGVLIWRSGDDDGVGGVGGGVAGKAFGLGIALP